MASKGQEELCYTLPCLWVRMLLRLHSALSGHRDLLLDGDSISPGSLFLYYRLRIEPMEVTHIRVFLFDHEGWKFVNMIDEFNAINVIAYFIKC